eukprot:1020359-Heterocapsa_arctica.AAC.1
MIGLMADDIEDVPGYNKHDPRQPDEMIYRAELRNAIASRLLLFLRHSCAYCGGNVYLSWSYGG